MSGQMLGQLGTMYNPNDPNDAVLEKSAPASRLLYAIGGVFVIIALVTCAGGLLFGSLFL